MIRSVARDPSLEIRIRFLPTTAPEAQGLNTKKALSVYVNGERVPLKALQKEAVFRAYLQELDADFESSEKAE
ncbi:MAG: hypothetical protein K9J81_09110 [Desulfohalobiaceae bacterium]|nr:hypothetical protein [Desulfohalobiaceae bacterium]